MPMKRSEIRGSSRLSTSRFLSVDDVAYELNVSRRSVWRWIKGELLSVYRFGGVTRVRRGDLDAFIKLARSD